MIDIIMRQPIDLFARVPHALTLIRQIDVYPSRASVVDAHRIRGIAQLCVRTILAVVVAGDRTTPIYLWSAVESLPAGKSRARARLFAIGAANANLEARRETSKLARREEAALVLSSSSLVRFLFEIRRSFSKFFALKARAISVYLFP